MTSGSHRSTECIWFNDRFVPAAEAAVSPFDRGFLYGDGVFETLRAERGQVLFLEDHLERLHRSLTTLRIGFGRPPDWQPLLRELLGRNNLLTQIASVKIIVTRGASTGPGLPECNAPTLCLMAHRYAPPEPDVYRKGWRLAVFRGGFSPPLANHKSLNYLFFLAARQTALDRKADDALIVDPYGKVAEASIGSLLARTGKTWWTPAADRQLPGITLKRVSEILATAGVEVEKRESRVEEIVAAETVWLLNSLMGVMPVREIDGHPLKNLAAEEAGRLREALFQVPLQTGAESAFAE